MATKKKHNYTIIKESGRTEFFADGDYFSILSSIGHEYMSAGGNLDRPNMLLRDGVIVVHSGIADIGHKYYRRRRELADKAEETMLNELTPDWL